jgi:hypothetical protein
MNFIGTAAGNDDTPAKETQIDDIYFLDTTGSVNNDFLGSNAVVILQLPDGEGTTNDFTPSAGTDNSALVDENPASSADYNDGATNADVDEYTFADIGENTVHGAIIETHVTVDALGRNRKFRHRCRSGATVGNGSDLSIMDDTNHRTIFEVDPNTSSLWTKANLNAAEFGVEVRD